MESILLKYFTSFFDKPIVQVANTDISLYTLIYLGVIFVIANAIFLGARLFLNIQIKRKKIRSAQGKSLLQLFGYIVTIIAFLFVLNELGYSLSYLFVGSTALLVGLGFGLQQLFLDVLSGIILLIDKNVNLGDVVRLDTTKGKENLLGRIQHIGLRTTLLQTVDNEFMIIPNSKFLSSGVTSFMKDKGSARFRIQIQVEYSQNVELVKKVLVESVLKDERIDKNPEPTVIVKDFQDNGVLLEVRFWMKELFNPETIMSDIRSNILEDFRKNNITIPFPQLVYHRADSEPILSNS